jgi:sulfur-oxidizing protein SoxA
MNFIKNITRVTSLLGIATLLLAYTTNISHSGSNPNPQGVNKMKSGYHWATAPTREMQDDDFSNPAFLWVDIGSEQWTAKDGEAGKSCASCHSGVETMKGVSATYPKYNAEDGKLRAVQHQINNCRTQQMKAKPWKWESDNMLGMAALVKNQSKGMPIKVKVSGEAQPFYNKGKKSYMLRRGGLDMSCKNCHMDYTDTRIRANILSNGLGNGFPTYRLKWQKIGSLHRRFRGCNKNVRATPFKSGSDVYTNLELFLTAHAMGMEVESPSVRN